MRKRKIVFYVVLIFWTLLVGGCTQKKSTNKIRPVKTEVKQKTKKEPKAAQKQTILTDLKKQKRKT